VRAHQDALVLAEVGAGVDAGTFAHADVLGAGHLQLDQVDLAGGAERGPAQRGRVADRAGGHQDTVRADLQDPEDDLGFLDVVRHRHDRPVRLGRGGQHDLQRDLRRVPEVQHGDPLVAGRRARVLQGGRVDDLHVPAEPDVRMRRDQLVVVAGRAGQDHRVRGAEVRRHGVDHQDLADGRRQRRERLGIGRDHRVDPLVQGLLHDRGRRAAGGADVKPAQSAVRHGFLP